MLKIFDILCQKTLKNLILYYLFLFGEVVELMIVVVIFNGKQAVM